MYYHLLFILSLLPTQGISFHIKLNSLIQMGGACASGGVARSANKRSQGNGEAAGSYFGLLDIALFRYERYLHVFCNIKRMS